MWYWSFDAIIYPFNEVILEGLASFGSWCGNAAPDHHREDVHSLLWFYVEVQGVVQAEPRRCVVPLWGISSSEDSLTVARQLQIRMVFSGDLAGDREHYIAGAD